MLRKRQAKSIAAQKRSSARVDRADPTTELATHEQIALLRRELNGLVAAWHHRTGQPDGVIHNDLRRKLGGPAAAYASSTQLKERIEPSATGPASAAPDPAVGKHPPSILGQASAGYHGDLRQGGGHRLGADDAEQAQRVVGG